MEVGGNHYHRRLHFLSQFLGSRNGEGAPKPTQVVPSDLRFEPFHSEQKLQIALSLCVLILVSAPIEPTLTTSP